MPKLRLIAGSGRSGTTWVLDSMADAAGLRPVFEPLHWDHSAVSVRNAHAYLTRRDQRPELLGLFNDLLDDRVRSIWTSYRVVSRDLMRVRPFSADRLARTARRWGKLAARRWQYRESERRRDVLIKCVRANLMLDWIRRQFDAEIVLLIRHPCAVVESQLRHAEAWNPLSRLETYKSDEALMEGPLSRYAHNLSRSFTEAQALAAIWCVENVVPSAQAIENGYTIVFYEELLENPDVEWPRVAAGLSLDSTPDLETLARPSQQASVQLQKLDSEGSDYTASYAKWRSRLGSRQIEEIGDVLESFGVQFYSVASDRPILETAADSANDDEAVARTSGARALGANANNT